MIGNLYKLNLVVLITVLIGAPEPPVILNEPYQVTAVSVNLTWRSGFNGGSTQTFHVQYKKNEDADFISDGQVFQDPGYHATVRGFISNLSDQTDYEFRIKAQNQFDELGPVYSISKVFRTKSE